MNRSTSAARIARCLPSALLAGVAALQIALAHTIGLSAWSGGGFGMFSTTDAGPYRHAHVFVLRPGIVREIEVPDSLAKDLERALTFPSDGALRLLARELAMLPSPDEGPPTAVRLQVWQTRHDPETLAPASRMLRGLDIAIESDAG